MRRVRLILALVAAWLALGALAQAAEFRPFTAEAFAAAQNEGRPILIHVHANWRPTCRTQAPIVRRTATAAEFERLVVFTLDFDRQAAERRRFGVRAQSTLIAFNGQRETTRSVGVTDPAAIAALMQSALH